MKFYVKNFFEENLEKEIFMIDFKNKNKNIF